MLEQNEIAQIKLACLELASKQCVARPSDTVKVAKELYEWVISH
jgi:hypothetical protein